METTCLLLYLFQLHWNGVCVHAHIQCVWNQLRAREVRTMESLVLLDQRMWFEQASRPCSQISTLEWVALVQQTDLLTSQLSLKEHDHCTPGRPQSKNKDLGLLRYLWTLNQIYFHLEAQVKHNSYTHRYRQQKAETKVETAQRGLS